MGVRGIGTRAVCGALLALLLGAGSAGAALDDVHCFLVPGTRAPVMIGGEGFTLMSVTPQGSLDKRFGVGGIARARFEGVAAVRADAGTALADGRIVLSGYAAKDSGIPGAEFPRHVALARFDASGHPDRSFGGGDGVVVTRAGGRGSEVAALRGGGLLVGGRTGSGMPMVMRLRRDGSVDRRFGTAGSVTVRARGPAPSTGLVTDIVSRRGGGFVVAAYGDFSGGTKKSSILARFGPRGRMDRRFADRGVLEFHAPGVVPEVYALEHGSGGSLIAASATRASPKYLGLVAIRGDGRLDRAYGGDGVVYGWTAPWVGFDLALAVDRRGTAFAALPVGTQNIGLQTFSASGAQAFETWGPAMPTFPGVGPVSVELRPSGDLLILASDLVGIDQPPRPVLDRLSHSGNDGRQPMPPLP